MKRFLSLLLLFVLAMPAQATITYFGSASVPTDNGTNTNSTPTITPPGSMQTGDLVIVIMQTRSGTVNSTFFNAGGQTWNDLGQNTTTTNQATRVFWARFNGTWSSNPSGSFTGTTCNTEVMHVFRPTSTTKVWAVETNTTGGFSGSTAVTLFNATRGPTSTTNASTVVVGCSLGADDNTYSASGTSWASAGTAQYRNTSGSDQSVACGYQIFSSAGSIPQLTLTQTALGADAVNYHDMVFYESDPASIPRRVIVISQNFFTDNFLTALG